MLIVSGNYNSCLIVPKLGPSRVSILFSNCRVVVIGLNINMSPPAVFVQYIRGRHLNIPAYEVYIRTHTHTGTRAPPPHTHTYILRYILLQNKYLSTSFQGKRGKGKRLTFVAHFHDNWRVSLIISTYKQYHIPKDHQREFTLHMILCNKTYSKVKRLKRCV
jgi:hypothetical protein